MSSGGITVDVSAFKVIPNILRGLQDRAELSSIQAIAKLAVGIRTTAIDLVHKGPKTGRMYGEHQASAPGEAPATDTGDLARSIKVRKGEKGVYYVVAGVPYASYLEFGTEEMEARPFMTPAFVQQMPNLKNELWESWKNYKDQLSTLSEGE